MILPKLGIAKISGICLTENRASCKVPEGCGFAKEYEGMGQYQGRQQQISKYSYSL